MEKSFDKKTNTCNQYVTDHQLTTCLASIILDYLSSVFFFIIRKQLYNNHKQMFNSSIYDHTILVGKSELTEGLLFVIGILQNVYIRDWTTSC